MTPEVQKSSLPLSYEALKQFDEKKNLPEIPVFKSEVQNKNTD